MARRPARAAAALGALLGAGAAQAIELVEPYVCPDGVTCLIQNLVDRDPGPDAADFTCGPMTYDGHKGTDFRVANLADLKRGVPVVAAAAGVVRATRDGEPDTGVEGMTEGRDCGNGVAIEHEDGWETQYCHLARGSVAVAPGDAVAAGERIGLMGYSGQTEFPHVHLTLRRDDEVVDPFDGRVAEAGCGARDAKGLWATPPILRLGGVIDVGLTGAPPTLEAVRAGLPEQDFKPGDGALVFWARAFGLRRGDVMEISLLGPDGAALAENAGALDREKAIEFRYIGKRSPPSGWPPGRYEGRIVIHRDGETLEERRIETVIE